MAQLARHGTDAGYKSELKTGNVCVRCQTAHRVYNRQFSKSAKAKGIKYGVHDVIDHLDTGVTSSPIPSRSRVRQGADTHAHTGNPPEPEGTATPGQGTPGPEPSPEPVTGPSLADRLSEGMRKLAGIRSDNDYISSDDPPDYLHESEPDPEPSGDWSEVGDEEFVINKAGMALIEDNLGTYLSVIGITMDMVDPYCGPILAEHLDSIVSRWTKVIARYPSAAKLFMSKDGGTIFTWIGAIQATWPVLLAIYDHHLAKNVKTQRDQYGNKFVIKTPKESPNGHVDSTMPPMPNFNYTVD